MWIYYSKFRKLYNSQFFDKNLSSGRSLKYWNKILKAGFLEKAFCLKFSFGVKCDAKIQPSGFFWSYTS